MKKTLCILFFLALYGLSAPAQVTEDGDFNDPFDPEQVILQDYPEEEEETPPPLEPPYVDEENQVLQNSATGAEKTREKTQLPPHPEENSKGRYRTKYIKHPNAEKGLFKITKDGEYLYKVKGSEKEAAASLRIGVFSAPNFINDVNNASYNDIYGGNDLIFFFDYEWSLGRFLPGLSFKLGSGLLYAKGKGRLEDGQEALEEFNFFMLPNSAALAYKFRYFDRQWFYPYVEGGLGAYVFTERRDDNKPPLGRWGAGFNVHAVAGLAFSMTALDRDRALRLDAEYGVNEVWLMVDLRQIVGFGQFDMTSTLINAGFSVEF